MNNRRSHLLVLLLSNPVTLESGQSREDRASDPNGELSLCGSNDLNLGVVRSYREDFLLKSLLIIGKHSASSRESNILKESRSEIQVCLINTLDYLLMNSTYIPSYQMRLEHNLWSPYQNVSN